MGKTEIELLQSISNSLKELSALSNTPLNEYDASEFLGIKRKQLKQLCEEKKLTYYMPFNLKKVFFKLDLVRFLMNNEQFADNDY